MACGQNGGRDGAQSLLGVCWARDRSPYCRSSGEVKKGCKEGIRPQVSWGKGCRMRMH